LKLLLKILFTFIFWFMVVATVLLFALEPEDPLSRLLLQKAA